MNNTHRPSHSGGSHYKPRSTGGQGRPARSSGGFNKRPAKSPVQYTTTPGSKAGGAGTFSPARPGSKPSFSRGGSRPVGAGRPPSRGSSFGGSRTGGKKFERKSTLDFTKLVRKATPTKEAKIPDIKHKFTDFKLDKVLEANILKKGYNSPTPVQDQSIPHIMTGVDVIGLANTGTGKTGAFLIPLIEKVNKDRTQKVLILAPTRELAVQIEKEFREFSATMRIFSTLAVGGMPIYNQIQGLARNPNFVIGTPGRIKDLSQRGNIKFAQFNNIVLDEVDHMLDMGFIEPITEILGKINSDRQSLFFSATMPIKIRELIKKFMKSPVTVEIASRDHVTSIDQDVVKVSSETEKFPELKRILLQPGFDKVLIFSETKRQVDKLTKALVADGYKAESIHGDKRQSQRRKALSMFDDNKVKILVATDVAARGLDIKNITHVINYTAPKTTEDYTHRIGRTGRGSNKGTALTFVH
jgi:superfamily II DNA/RNA helicase